MSKRMLCGVGLASLVLGGCMSRNKEPQYQSAGALLDDRVAQTVSQLKYQNGQELMQSISWLIYVGEPAIPKLIEGLSDGDPRTRSTSAFILSEIRDRRVIPHLRPLLSDQVAYVRYEGAAALVTMGEWSGVPTLIQGLADGEKRNRFKVYDVLHRTTGLDFGYDPLGPEEDRARAAEKWRAWWVSKSKEIPG